MPVFKPESMVQRALAWARAQPHPVICVDLAKAFGIAPKAATKALSNLVMAGYALQVSKARPTAYRMLAGEELQQAQDRQRKLHAQRRRDLCAKRRGAAPAKAAAVPCKPKPATKPKAQQRPAAFNKGARAQGAPVVDIKGDMKPKGTVDYSRAKLTIIPAPEHMGEGQRWRYSASSPEATRLQDEWKRLRGQA